MSRRAERGPVVGGTAHVMRVLVSALVLASPLAAASAQGNADRLRGDIGRILAEEGLVGAAWATVHPDGSIRTDAVGYRDNAARIPFSDETRVHVGSVAKTVLATGILRLVTEGRIGLDDPVSRYLPELIIRNPWERTDPVTVRHLLDHTSGLEDARLWQLFSASVASDTPLSHALARADGSLRIRVRPGSRLSYSNLGYTLLGMIVEAVTHEPYERYLDEQLLQPLGMRASTFGFTTQAGASDTSLAWGHLDDGEPYAAAPIMLRPAGQFTTTAQDLAVFARFLMGDGTIDGVPFIRPDLMRARGRASTTEAVRAGLHAGYALGLARRDRYGAIGYCHNGTIVGFVALICLYREDGKAFVISINTDSERARYERVFEALARSLELAPVVPSLRTGRPSADLSEWEGHYVLAPNRLQTFAYLDVTAGFLRARWRNERLVLAPAQGNKLELRPMGGHLFAAQDRLTTSHVVLRDSAGAYLISDGARTYEKVSPYYLGSLWVSLLFGLLGIVWFLGAGIVTLARLRAAAWCRPEMVPFLGVLALFAPLPLFLRQSFMQLGDMTAASVLLAATTAALPLTMLALLWRTIRSGRWTTAAIVHACCAVAVLQWCAVLAFWGLLPMRLWI